MEAMLKILEECGLDGWLGVWFLVAMFWSKIFGSMLITWWEQVKVKQWQKQLGIEPDQKKKNPEKARASATIERAVRRHQSADGQ